MSKGIYIRGIDNFPAACISNNGCCFAYSIVDKKCMLREDKTYHFSTKVLSGKPEWCPLLEVEPHGDLIDRDRYLYSGDLLDEPVVIPADL